MPKRIRKITIIFRLCFLLGVLFLPPFFNYLFFPLTDTAFSRTDAPPVLKLLGEESINLRVGDEFVDPGALATDDYDRVLVSVEGAVDTSTADTYILDYSTFDSAGHTASVSRTVTVLPAPRGTIYLTFDDGPGDYTNQLLDILKQYDVKVTFFVTGAGSDDVLRREYTEGHSIGLHTLSHNYSYVYASTANFFSDLYAVQDRVKNVTGYTSTLMRFPGGSSNTVSARYDGGSHIMTRLTREVEEKGFTYFDWNISSGDAGGATTADQVYENTVSRLGDGDYVVLQHDIKPFSVDAVERIIQYGLENGYEFKPLDASSFSAHHGVNN